MPPRTIDAPPRAFLSYARSDGEAFASSLRARLEREQPQITLWHDRARMEGGVGWWKQITEAIEQVEFMIMVLTPAAMASDVARKEWRYARQQGVRVCPVMGVPPDRLDTRQLPTWMRKVHFYDLDREWDTFIGFLNSAERDNRVPFMAPDLRDDFVQRPVEFDALLSVLLDSDRANPLMITTALQGAGGFGKTTLAIALCHHDDVITAFDDGILWATLGPEPKVQHELTKLYAALTGERLPFLDIDDAAIHLAERLDQKNCLIVIDDAWDPQHVMPFLRGGKQCSRLITTRRLQVLSETGARKVSINEMTADQSLELLIARLRVAPADTRRLLALAHRLGEWPLLLKLAASQLRERMDRGDSFEGALSYVETALQRRGPVAFDRRDASARNDAVGRTVGASLELLTADERRRCAELAIFPEGIAVPLGAIQSLWQLDAFETEEIVQRLDNAAVVDFDLKVGAIRLHNVLQAYLRSELPDIKVIHARLVTEGWPDHHAMTDAYAWRWLSWHLMQAEQPDRLRSLLSDYQWIDAKLHRTDVQALLVDFDLLADQGELRAVHDAIRLASHGLARDPEQLAAQLIGRLACGQSQAVDTLLADAARLTPKPSFRLRHTSLTHAGGALNGILKGHTGAVEGLAMSDDGHRLISGSADWSLRVWDMGTGRLMKTLMGHSAAIWCVAMTADGRRAVSGSEDRTIRVWDLEDGRTEHLLRAHWGAVQGIALSSNGQMLASISEDKTVSVWELPHARGRQLFTGYSHQMRAIAWMPDGTRVVFSPGDETVLVLSIADKRVVATCRGHDSLVRAVAVSTDGRHILTGSSDRTMRLFDASDGRLLQTCDGHEDQIDCVGITRDGRIGVSGAQDGTLRSWDLETGKTLAVLEGHASFIRSLVIAPDDSRLISGSSDKTIRHWSLHRTSAAPRTTPRAGPVSMLAISGDGSRAISASRLSPMSVWDVSHGTITGVLSDVSPIPPMKSPVTRMSGMVTAVELTHDGRQAVSASRDAAVRLWDLDDGRLLHRLAGHSDAVIKIAVSAGGTRAVSLSRDRTVRVWDLVDGRYIRGLASEDNVRAVTSQTSDPLLLELGQQLIHDITLSPISREAELAISADGRYVLLGDEAGVVGWDVVTGTVVKERLDDFIVVTIAMGLPGLAVLASRTGWIKVWDIEARVTVHTFQAHDRQILDLIISPDLQQLVTAGRDNRLRVWQLSDFSLVGQLEGVDSGLDQVAIAPDARVAYSIYGDTIVASDLLRLSRFGSVSFDHQITVVAVAADGTSVAAGDESGTVHFLSVDR
jgi:WD40 repeat protein